MPAKLIVTRTSDPQWRMEQEFEQELITIGRHETNLLVLEDPEKIVSRHHAQVKMKPDGYYLIDCESVNATFLNDQKLVPGEPYLLKSGDRIKIGEYQIEFVEVKDVSEPTVAYVNPFVAELEGLKAALQQLQDKYAGEHAHLRREALKDGLRQILGELNGAEAEEVNAALAEVLGEISARPGGEAMPDFTPPGTPSGNEKATPAMASPAEPRVAASPRTDRVLNLFLETVLALGKEAVKFRGDFIGIAELPREHPLHEMSLADLKSFLLDAGLTEADAEAHLNDISQQLEELRHHYEALLDGYRACIKDGSARLLKNVNPVSLEKYFGKQEMKLLLFKLPYRVFPFLVRHKAYQALKQMIAEMMAEGARSLDRNMFRPAFINAYMETMAGYRHEFTDSGQFWKPESS
ncbi:MAG: FHA domain-containing protein [Calditrichaeota bacterium]|nr:MAG: FHA domain-containing protein [Calditrichota bacterium]